MNEEIIASSIATRFNQVRVELDTEVEYYLHNRHPKGFRARESGRKIANTVQDRFHEEVEDIVFHFVRVAEGTISRLKTAHLRRTLVLCVLSGVFGAVVEMIV